LLELVVSWEFRTFGRGSTDAVELGVVRDIAGDTQTSYERLDDSRRGIRPDVS